MNEVDPAAYQPPLRWWSQLWRYVLAVLISAVTWLSGVAQWQAEHAPRWFWADLVGGLVALALVTRRRQHPVAVAAAVTVIGAFSYAAAGPAVLAVVSLATRRRLREIVGIGLLVAVQTVVVTLIDPTLEDDWRIVLALSVPIVVTMFAVGMYVGSRRELLYTLRERARVAEAEQASRVAQARTAERARIAREMHDVLAHRISMVAMHAGALAYRTDLPPEEVRTSSEVIRDNAHLALTDLREVLGILRADEDAGAGDRPQPSWRDLPDLVSGARAAGMRVSLTDDLSPHAPPERIGRTAYRVVQEALTNAHKHAPDTMLSVVMRGEPGDGIVIEARNPLRVGSTQDRLPTSGLGLVGLSERADLVGGTLSHRVTGDEFVLTLVLPWPA
ncbi:two-component sensor histidine kinase [Mumia sp. zg.B17]|uniref:sensor histidine kinase n=1 Tax=unclassified Mumia TaxID=2621872 RepID=UPI001C6F2622|nr:MULTISPECIES: histidine kinase [unclassified Mumia]MBW9205503.1 two-component sensor histidine kinase [Mumia sp. zg.B17]MBW9208496.1 two-component sensor histidine kinase [Mumia sp. zg.B21]MDD9349559.1 histidine kinase [Mumia sp.]